VDTDDLPFYHLPLKLSNSDSEEAEDPLLYLGNSVQTDEEKNLGTFCQSCELARVMARLDGELQTHYTHTIAGRIETRGRSGCFKQCEMSIMMIYTTLTHD